MHNLHYIIINAESADDAAESALLEIQDWGNENNWRSVGGVASEDGKDLIENHQDARWTLSGLKPDDASPDDNSYFAWAIDDIWAKIDGDIKLPHHPYSKSYDLQVTLRAIALELLHSDCTNICIKLPEEGLSGKLKMPFQNFMSGSLMNVDLPI